MPQVRYRIFQLSTRAVMSYAAETEDGYAFDLSASATEKCKSRTATHEQDSNALFFQTMCVLYGNGYSEPNDGTLILDLSDATFYMDFARIFDRSAASKKAVAPSGEGPCHVPSRRRGAGLRLRPAPLCGL